MNIVSRVTDSLLTSYTLLPVLAVRMWAFGLFTLFNALAVSTVKLSETAQQSLFCKYASIRIGSLDTTITNILFSFTYRIPLPKEITGRSCNRVIDIIQR